eukprot:TRINITY_DN2783_c0_g1_i1.p1 TRINITY_DN2783_c0_g1~~TRINITY_DN2783_c0_g1_i1.p1  ORF type:complete len:341 (+),score=81.36 TRINITY_DN2783_c0_g1_i1:95-1117(+)
MQYRLSVEEGFAEVHKDITEMIEQLANEPSVGLFYIQQHVHNAVPNLHKIKTQVADTTRDVVICTEDMKDATNTIKLMQECGPLIIEQMLKKLTSSITLISRRQQHNLQQRKGKVQNQFLFPTKDSRVLTTIGSAFQRASKVAWRSHVSEAKQNESNTAGRTCFSDKNVYNADERVSTVNAGTSTTFVQSVIKSAYQHAGSLGWSTSDINEDAPSTADTASKVKLTGKDSVTGKSASESAQNGIYLHQTVQSIANRFHAIESMEEEVTENTERDEADVLPVSSHALSESVDCMVPQRILDTTQPESGNHSSELRNNFDQFRAECAAKFEAWLHEDEDGDS